MKIVTAAQMRSLDQGATSVYGIPSILLMENAARGLVDKIECDFGPLQEKRIVIFAGRGNNGGDGIAAARHLRMRGAMVAVYLFAETSRVAGDARISLDIWKATGGRFFEQHNTSSKQLRHDLSHSDLVIDALLGTGLSQALRAPFDEAVNAMNCCENPIVSIDIPTGISSDTGEILGDAVRAEATYTMALPKWGHFLRDGMAYRGRLQVVDIGIPPKLINDSEIKVELITADSLKGLLPSRRKGSHKGSFGHLLVLAGSTGKRGAAQMCSLAAFRCGAGLVTTAWPKSIDASTAPPTMEIMTLPLPETAEGSVALSAEKILFAACSGKSVLAIGPGLSQDPETVQLVQRLISEVALPMVVDADGLNAIAQDLSLLKQKKGELILTPHPGEMGRLIGQSAAAVQKDRFNIAARFAEAWGVTLLLKGSHTVIASPEGLLYVNDTGNSGMATAGVGDVLTGMIAGFLAQGIKPLDAARLGIALHGSAGDLAAEEQGEVSLLASDLIDKIPKALMNQTK